MYHITGLWSEDDWTDEEEEYPEEEAVPDEDILLSKTAAAMPGAFVRSGAAAGSLVPAHPEKKDVAVLLPYSWNQALPFKAKQAGKDLQEALGGKCDVFTEDEVTLERMKHLDEYGVVIMKTHGKIFAGKPYMIQSPTNSSKPLAIFPKVCYNRTKSVALKQ